jgi:O-antigen ligase
MITNNSQSFLYGYGVTNAIKLFEEEKRDFGNFEVTVNNPHNFILLIMIQYGFLTLLPYLLFILSLIIMGIKKRIKIPVIKDRRKLELSIAIILGMLIQNQFEEIMVVPEFPVMSVTLIFMGLIYCFINSEKRKHLVVE